MDLLSFVFVENIQHLFAVYPWLSWSVMFTLGLIFGSFAGCASYRLPLMLEQDWRNAANEILELPSHEKTISLLQPRSFCPQCKNTISLAFLIPFLGYFFSLGRCQHCKTRISIIYPAIELATAFMFCWVYSVFGATIETLIAAVLGLALLLLLVIDARKHLLPDVILLPLLWLGLLVNYFGLFIGIDNSFWGVFVGYGFFFLLYWVFYALTGRESLGRGDIKLLAALGAWAGVWSLPGIVFFAACSGLLWLLLRRVLGKGMINEPMAFGPFLILAGWVSFLYGPDWFFDASLVLKLWQQL